MTSSKKTEHQLDEEGYRQMMDLAGFGIGYYDNNGNVLFYNKQALKNLKWKKSDYVGKNLTEIFGKKAGGKFIKRIEQAAKSKIPLQFEDYVELGGNSKWYFSTYKRIINKKGEIDGIQIISADITKQKENENAISEQYANMEAIFESTDDLIAYRDKNNCLVAFNSGFKKMIKRLFGINAVPGLNILDLHKPRNKIFLKKVMSDALSGKTFKGEFSLIHENNEKRYYDITIHPIIKGKEIIGTLELTKDNTDKKRAEEALHSSEHWMKTIFNSIGEAIFVAKSDGTITNVNKTAEKMLGYSRNQLLNLPKDKLHADYKQFLEFRKRIRIAFRKDETTTFKSFAQRKSGEIFPVENTVSILRDENQRKIGLIISVHDITERKKIEDNLKSSQARYQGLFDNMNSGVAVYEVKGEGEDFIFKDFNKAGENIDNEKKESLIGKSIFEVRPGIKQFGLTDVMKRVWKTGKPEHLPTKQYLDNKLSRWYENYIYKLPTDEIVAVFSDITEQKKAEQRVNDNTIFLQTLINAIPAPVFYKSLDGRYINCNKAYEDFHGITATELRGKTVYDIAPKKLADIYHRKDRELFKNQGIQIFESKMVDSFGKYHEVVYHKAVFKDTYGNTIGLIGVIIDITESKHRETEIEKSRKQLKQLNIYLQKAKEEERKIISRELHDELGQILTATKIDVVTLRKNINKDNSNVSRIDNIISLLNNAIETIRRITFELRPHIIDDLGLIAAIEWYVSDFRKRTGLNIILKTGKDIVLNSNIELVIFRIVQESMTNIARHSMANNAYITLLYEKNKITMEICDDGIGIPSSSIKSLNSCGLLNMKERAKEIGGTLSINSALNRGTKIRLDIPEEALQ